MRWIIAILALAGMMAAILALREHYRTEGASPCSINERWDCGTVNKSKFALIGGLFADTGPGAQPGFLQRKLPAIARIPVADVGIAGYVLLALLAFKRWWHALTAASLIALAFSLYLAHVEKDILGVWCIYCVISLGVILTITLLSIVTFLLRLSLKRKLPE